MDQNTNPNTDPAGCTDEKSSAQTPSPIFQTIEIKDSAQDSSSTSQPVVTKKQQLPLLNDNIKLDDLAALTNATPKWFGADQFNEKTAYIFHLTTWNQNAVPSIQNSVWYAYRYDPKTQSFNVKYTPEFNGNTPALYDTPYVVVLSIEAFPVSKYGDPKLPEDLKKILDKSPKLQVLKSDQPQTSEQDGQPEQTQVEKKSKVVPAPAAPASAGAADEEPPANTAYLTYTFLVTKQTKAYIASAQAVAGALLGTKTGGLVPEAAKLPNTGPEQQVVCVARYDLNVKELPSDIKVTATATYVDKGNLGSKDSPLVQTFHAIDSEWFDLGIGIVLSPLKETVVSTSNGQSKLTAVNRLNPYGIADLFLLNKWEPKDSWKSPSIQVGIPLSGQPLHRPYAGLGETIPFVEQYLGFPVRAYGGIAFMRVQYATDGPTHWVNKRILGIELPIAQLVSKISSLKTK